MPPPYSTGPEGESSGRDGIPLRDHDVPKDAACRHPVTPMDLQMRIPNRDMAKRSGTRATVSGTRCSPKAFKTRRRSEMAITRLALQHP